MKKTFTQTRKELKHDMLLTFMANSKTAKPKQAAAAPRPRLLKTLLSLFM